MSIIVVGATFVDIKGFPEDIYIPAGRNAGRIEYVHGGVARNVAEDIANAGYSSVFLSVVDDSALGADVVRHLQDVGVDVSSIITEKDGMGTWMAVFDNRGEMAGSISKRPNMAPLKALMDERGDEIFSASEAVVIEADIEEEVVRRALELSEKHGKPAFGLVSNMTLAAERMELIRRFTCFICNQQEAGILFGENYDDITPCEMRDILLQKLQQHGLRSMVVTMGEKGAVFADCWGERGICPAHKVTVRDTTGAGDAFCAGLSAGLTYGMDMAEAVELGTALAASVITSTDNVCPRAVLSVSGA